MGDFEHNTNYGYQFVNKDGGVMIVPSLNVEDAIKLKQRVDEMKRQAEKEKVFEAEYTEIVDEDKSNIASGTCDKRQRENTEDMITQTANDFYDCHVYVSYPWSDSALMDDICRCLNARKIDYFRDKDICGFRKNIQEFEEEIGNGKMVIAIINEHSMESIDCMYEVCTLARNGHLDKRLFPIVDLPNMKRDSKACEDYLKKWEADENDILERYSTNPGDKVNELRELKYINCIKTEFPKFWNYISKYNTSTLETLQKDDWKILMDEVELYLKQI